MTETVTDQRPVAAVAARRQRWSTPPGGCDMILLAMRRFLVCVVVALALPAVAQAEARVVAFYYPWYGTAALDGAYQHWSQNGHTPPVDIASSYYPARGLYSSSDPLVLAAQMDEIRGAGIDEIAVSWWGQGLRRGSAAAGGDRRRARRRDPGRGASRAVRRAARSTSTVADVAYLRTLGITTFYVYRALDFPIADWAAANTALHQGGVTLLAQTALVGAAAAAGFDGIYTYDILTYGGNKFARICNEAHALHLLCAPSVGPGYLARRGDGDPRVKPRRNGRTYDAMWARRHPGAGRHRHDHVVQRVARGHADRAGGAAGSPRRLPLPLVRRSVRPPRRRRRGRVSRAHALLGRACTARRSSCTRREEPRSALLADAAQLRVVEVDERVGPLGRARARPRPLTSRMRAARRRCRRPGGPSAGGRCPRSRAAPRADRSARSSRSRCRAGSPRCSTRATGRKPSPRFASVVGHAQIREPGGGQQVELVAVGMGRVHDRRAGCQTALRGRAARSAADRARPGIPRSRAPARRRGCGAGARARRRSGRALQRRAGQARTEWGARPTRIPVLASVSSSRRYVGDRVLAEPRRAAAQVAGVEADERDPGLGSGRRRGSGLVEPEVVELADRRVTGARSSR